MDNDTTDAASAQQNLEESSQWWSQQDKDEKWQMECMKADHLTNLDEYINNGWMNMEKEREKWHF